MENIPDDKLAPSSQNVEVKSEIDNSITVNPSKIDQKSTSEESDRKILTNESESQIHEATHQVEKQSNNENNKINDTEQANNEDDDDDDACNLEMEEDEERKSNGSFTARDQYIISEEGISMKRIPSMLPKRKIMSMLNSQSSPLTTATPFPLNARSYTMDSPAAAPNHQSPAELTPLNRITTSLTQCLASIQSNELLSEFHADIQETASPFFVQLTEKFNEYLQPLQPQLQVLQHPREQFPNPTNIRREELLSDLLEEITLFRSQFEAIATQIRSNNTSTATTTTTTLNIFQQIDENLSQLIELALKYINQPPALQQSQERIQSQQQQNLPPAQTNSNNMLLPPPGIAIIPPAQPAQAQGIAAAAGTRAAAAQITNPNVFNNNNNNNNNNQQQQQQRNVHVYQMRLDFRSFQLIMQSLTFFSKRFDILVKLICLISLLATTLIIHSLDMRSILAQTSQQFALPAGSSPPFPSQPHSDCTNPQEPFDAFPTLFTWLSLSRQGKLLMINIIILIVSLMIIIVRGVWNISIGTPISQEHRALLKKNFLRYFPLRHLVLLRCLDDSLWQNQFSLAMFIIVFSQASISRFYSSFLNASLKSILLSLTESYEAESNVISKLRRFNRFLLLWNAITCTSCMIIFSSAPGYVVLPLVYAVVVALVENVKFERCCVELLQEQGLQYYVNCNSDIVQEPTIHVESNFEAIRLLLKLAYLLYCIILYFQHKMLGLSYQLIFVLYYIALSCIVTLRNVKEFVQTRRSILYFQQNVDTIFPKLRITEENKDDVCSICHDELLVGRKLADCSHAFHLKCLFQWIKTNPQPKCPICRVEIRNASHLQNHRSSSSNQQQQQQQQQQQLFLRPLFLNLLSQPLNP